MNEVPDFVTLVSVVFGAPADAFLLTTLTVFCAIAVLRRCAQFHPKTARINTTEWGKALLTLLTVLAGIGMAFVAANVGVYTAKNPIMIGWVGFWNGILATTGWQFAKRFKVLRQFVQGLDGGQP